MRGKKCFLNFFKNLYRLSRYGNIKVSKLGVFCLLCYVIENCDFSHNELSDYVFIMQWLPVSMKI